MAYCESKCIQRQCNEYKYDMESQSESDDSHNNKQLAQPVDLTRQPKKGHQKIGNKKQDKGK